MSDDPAAEAAAAVREAEKRYRDIPNAVLSGHPIGECPDCGSRFDYGWASAVGNLDPCPECGSHDWHKWGYQYNGGEIRKDEAWDKYDAPPEVPDR